MTRVLLVKTSSLGDVVHALPAVTEAAKADPSIQFDWVVEEAFSTIPALHPAVARVIPIGLRRWRRHPFRYRAEVVQFLHDLRDRRYDLVIDSQGLLKSAVVTGLSHGPASGFDRQSARESVASIFYRHDHAVAQDLHAVQRQKQLFAQALGYEVNPTIDYGLGHVDRAASNFATGPVLLLHGTTWVSKEWPESYWQQLAAKIRAAGYKILVPAGNDVERERAGRITANNADEILDRLSFEALLEIMRGCAGAVSVDTGLGHLATAFGLSVVGLYGATSPALTGFVGPNASVKVSSHLPCIPCRKRHCQYEKSADSSNIHPPCYAQHSPEMVWQALLQQIGNLNPAQN